MGARPAFLGLSWGMFAYTVVCEFDDFIVAQRWVDWLRDQHLREVCEAGAASGQVVWVDTAAAVQARCEARYLFNSRQEFEHYERDHAPRLRKKGLRNFPLSLGLRYQRSTGEVVAHHPPR